MQLSNKLVLENNSFIAIIKTRRISINTSVAILSNHSTKHTKSETDKSLHEKSIRLSKGAWITGKNCDKFNHKICKVARYSSCSCASDVGLYDNRPSISVQNLVSFISNRGKKYPRIKQSFKLDIRHAQL